jgi:hypothetical protein
MALYGLNSGEEDPAYSIKMRGLATPRFALQEVPIIIPFPPPLRYGKGKIAP